MLTLLVILSIFSGVGIVSANQDKATVEIKFTGDEADVAGFAQCEITVTPSSNGARNGYYLVYYTDGNKVLDDYDEATAIKMNNLKTVKGYISDGMMIPYGAKGIAVFESTFYFLKGTPDIKDAIATAEIPVSKRTPDLGEPEFSFGALSDTHMNYEQHSRGAYEKLRASMDFFAEKGMDIVVITGDVVGDRGENPDLEAQYEKHIEIINASDFPIEKVYEASGNHGNTPKDIALMDKYLGGSDEVHPYENSPYYHVLFKGENGSRDNLFIFMSQEINASGDSASYDNFSSTQIDWLEALLEKHDDGKTNIFISLHSPFLQYGAGDIKNGSYTACITFKDDFKQNMRLKALLENHKDSIVMSGHTHVSFYENANYSDEYNSFARTVHIGSNCQPCAYGSGSSMTRSYDGRENVTVKYGSEGYTVEVYSDFIVYTGYNFSTGKKIPDACFLIPVKAYGGAGRPEDNIPTPDEAFEGSGTVEDPYLIKTANDFKILTDGFNASNNETESKMYGYGKYFLQTASIDMTNVEGYSGTSANGNGKCYFAGVYNGNGYTITVDINDSVQRSVFPYVYGAICNLRIEGSIASETSAQPVRTLYGSVVNCIFELDLRANIANGILYSNYGKVYNVYSKCNLSGSGKNPVSCNDTSVDYTNVYHFSTSGGSIVNDEHGVRSDDVAKIASDFNDTANAKRGSALEKLGGFELINVKVNGESLVFENNVDEDENNPEQDLSEGQESMESVDTSEVSDNESEPEITDDEGGSNLALWITVIAVAVVALAFVAIKLFLKK